MLLLVLLVFKDAGVPSDTTLIGDAELSSLKSPNTVGEVSFCPNVKAEEEKPGSTPPNGLMLLLSLLFPPPGFEVVGLTECLVLLYDDLTRPSAPKPPVFFFPDEVLVVVVVVAWPGEKNIRARSSSSSSISDISDSSFRERKEEKRGLSRMRFFSRQIVVVAQHIYCI